MWAFQPFHIYSSISEMALPHIFPLNSFPLFYPYFFLWGWTFSWMPRSFQMCIPSPEHWYWYDFHRSHCHLQGRAAALFRAESARKQVPPTSPISHHIPQASLHLLLGCSGKDRKYLSPGAAETAALQRCRGWRSFCNCLTEHQGHCGHFAGI